jgi:FSR family fosmidomycin resistance protein-like MFS transporter
MNSSSAASLSPSANPIDLRQDAGVIGLVSLAHAGSHFSHLLLPLMFPVFMTEFGLSYSELGLLMTVFFVVSGIGQAASGFVVDRFGARPVLFGATGLIALACLLAANAGGYGAFIGVALLAGLGNSPYHPVDFTILNQRVSVARLGHAYSAHGLSGTAGWAVAPAYFAGMTALTGWRGAYLGAALLYVAILMLLILKREPLRTETAHATPANRPGALPAATAPVQLDMRTVLRLPVVWWCFTFFILSTMTLALVQGYSVSLLKEMHGIGFEAASLTLTAYMLCSAAGVLTGGFVASRFAARSDRVVALCMCAGALLLALCGTGWLGGLGTMVVLAATGFAVGIGGPSRDMMIKLATPKGATGRVYGLVYSGLDVGFAIAPLVFGVFMDHGWYAATFAGAAVTLLLGASAALTVGARSRPAAMALPASAST